MILKFNQFINEGLSDGNTWDYNRDYITNLSNPDVYVDYQRNEWTYDKWLEAAQALADLCYYDHDVFSDRDREGKNREWFIRCVDYLYEAWNACRGWEHYGDEDPIIFEDKRHYIADPKVSNDGDYYFEIMTEGEKSVNLYCEKRNNVFSFL